MYAAEQAEGLWQRCVQHVDMIMTVRQRHAQLRTPLMAGAFGGKLAAPFFFFFSCKEYHSVHILVFLKTPMPVSPWGLGRAVCVHEQVHDTASKGFCCR